MRKKNSIFNIFGNLGSYILTTVFSFITQTFIVKILGIEYTGINGLFSNIITMLSVAELGFGTSIVFKLYKSIATNNTEEIKSWIRFYKVCYRIVGVTILGLGLLLLPFVPGIVGEVSIKENVSILFLIALMDTVLSYLMSYKRSLLYADQKNYIISIIHMCYVFFMNLTQIILLYLTHNYFVFLVVKLFYRLIENIIINLYVNKHYPYILEPADEISKAERKDIFERIKAIFLQKISFVINKGIDNIIISIFLGISSVGFYTNYHLIVNALTSITYQIINSFTASVGNLLTENNKNKNFDIYKKVTFVNSFLTCIMIVGFTCCVNSFIQLWLGYEYLLSIFVVFSFSFYIYADSIRRSITIFKDAAGICKDDKYMYIYMILINLVSSIILSKYFGIMGVITGTAISYLFLILFSYPKYIFIKVFDVPMNEYYKILLKYFLIIIISLCLSYLICYFICLDILILNFVVSGIISIVVSFLIFTISLYGTPEYEYFLNIFLKRIKRI